MKKKSYFLKGSGIYLSYPSYEDVGKDWFNWFNDPEINSLIGKYPWPNSVSDQKKYLDDVRRNKDRLLLGINIIKNSKMIGVISLSKLNSHHRSAESSIIIGNSKYKNGIYALEALALLTEFGLMRLNLNRIFSSTLLINKNAHNLNNILGWRKVGICKKSHYYKGQYVDSIIFEILKKDWVKSKKRPSLNNE
jgi:[ribosomal protein S5]-alanine N-acetyltransferase